ncbi:MAG: hypothetical protein JNJ45_08445 [Chthonomonas sp.]|nr:hypothetical protein [Chthonomonas sp.]
MVRGLCLLMAAIGCLGVARMDGGAPLQDPIKRLQQGNLKLSYHPTRGYLDDLLKALNISPTSQVLVWSKSSLQTDFIGRKTPRAMYFSESVYVGWSPGAPDLEILSIDPVRGPQMYSLPNKKGVAPKFKEELALCTRCHAGNDGRPVRLLAQSTMVPESGYPRAFASTINVTSKTPFAQRWGGWYVSGTHGAMRHMGNSVSTGTDEQPKQDVNKGANITDLSKFFNTKPYLSPHSDLAALMVLDHQIHVHTILSRVQADTKDLREVSAEEVEPLVKALLCVGETKLTAPIKGVSGFTEAYGKQGPLHVLDLKTRLYRLSCSPLIGSDAFRALNPKVRALVWSRIHEVLAGDEYPHIPAAVRGELDAALRAKQPEYLAASSK